jgi:hypothetical protein
MRSGVKSRSRETQALPHRATATHNAKPIKKSMTPRKPTSPGPDLPLFEPLRTDTSHSIALAYAKVLEVMVASPMSPACEDWRRTIIKARPRRGQVIDTPRAVRTGRCRDPPENRPGNFIGEVKEGKTFEIESPFE